MRIHIALLVLAVPFFKSSFATDPLPLVPDIESLYRMDDSQTKMANALWIENPAELKFGEGRSKVVIADLAGPGIITMIHFAYSESFAVPERRRPNRDVILRIFWDEEPTPSVECPLYDFFCDPNGSLDRVESALVNKRRGWNCYFPMPFAKRAVIEVSAEGGRYPSSWQNNPCYSYVMYKTLDRLTEDTAYFHSTWRQQTLLLGKEDYKVFEAEGKGHFVGWNVTVRGVGGPKAGYPVDENVKFSVDGEEEPSIEWQGIEDAFGFSYGFPESGNDFPFTAYQPFYGNGAAALRLCVHDRISFSKSLNMTVGFGKNEHPSFREIFSKPENPLQLSSVAYWYQTEPHVSFASLPPANERQPANTGGSRPPMEAKLLLEGNVVALNCGNPNLEVECLKEGWDFALRQGFSYAGFPTPINHCWADEKSLDFDLLCPNGSEGTLRLFLLDGDNFQGGRKQSVSVQGHSIGDYENYQQGRWVEVPVSSSETSEGRISVVMKNNKPGANAVVSLVRFVEKK